MRGDLYDIPKPDRDQTLALVGWLVLCNAFGPVVDGGAPDFRAEELPSPTATRWVGYLMSVVRGGDRPNRRQRNQTVLPNHHRKVKAR